MQDEGPTTRQRWLRFLPLVLFAVLIAAAYFSGLSRYLSFESLLEQRQWLRDMVEARPLISILAFFVIYVAAVALALPAAFVLTLFSGFLFGVFLGGSIVALAATSGACILFLSARGVFGDTLRRRAGPFLSSLSDRFRDNAFFALLALRLAPVFPFFIVNIAPAFFGVPLRVYVAATFLGILPGTFTYAWLGSGLEALAAKAAAKQHALTPADLITPQLLMAFAALAALALLPLVVQAWRNRRSA